MGAVTLYQMWDMFPWCPVFTPQIQGENRQSIAEDTVLHPAAPPPLCSPSTQPQPLVYSRLFRLWVGVGEGQCQAGQVFVHSCRMGDEGESEPHQWPQHHREWEGGAMETVGLGRQRLGRRSCKTSQWREFVWRSCGEAKVSLTPSLPWTCWDIILPFPHPLQMEQKYILKKGNLYRAWLSYFIPEAGWVENQSKGKRAGKKHLAWSPVGTFPCCWR